MAMPENKRYVANNRQSLLLILSLPGGGQTSIEFRPGYGLQAEGYFLTNNEQVQEALEADKRFGKTYRLDEINNMPLTEYNARKSLKEKGIELPKDTRLLEERVFPRVQDAKEWLEKDHNVPISLIGNRAKIIEKARELGFLVKFELNVNQ